MFTNKKVMITIFSVFSILIVGMIATIIVFASQIQNITSDITITYVAKDISGSLSASYQIGDNGSPVSLIKAGTSETKITFDASEGNVNGSLVPQNELELTFEDSYVLFEYEFENYGGKPYYVTLSYADTNNDDTNIKVEYSLDKNSSFSTSPVVGTIPAAIRENNEMQGAGTQSYYIKLSIQDNTKDALFSGRFAWTLSNEEPEAELLNGTSFSFLYTNEIQNTIEVSSVEFKVGNGENKEAYMVPDERPFFILADNEKSNEYINATQNSLVLPTDFYSIYSDAPFVEFEVSIKNISESPINQIKTYYYNLYDANGNYSETIENMLDANVKLEVSLDKSYWYDIPLNDLMGGEDAVVYLPCDLQIGETTKIYYRLTILDITKDYDFSGAILL